MAKTVDLFCVILNKMAPAEITSDAEKQEHTATWYGEAAEGEKRPIIHQVKFAKGDLAAGIARHNAVNVPKVLAEHLEAEKAEMDAEVGAL